MSTCPVKKSYKKKNDRQDGGHPKTNNYENP
jgi:hypothetical protein